MITLKTEKEIEILQEGGAILARIIKDLAKLVKPGLSVDLLDVEARRLFVEADAKPAFLNYRPQGARRAYPSAVCISVNEEIVHGIPNENPRILVDGDIVTLDAGCVYKGLITDHAITVGVGSVSKEDEMLMNTTRESLMSGIKEARGGNTIGDIAAAIEAHARKQKLHVCEGLCGHGVGYSVHEDPYVLNQGRKGAGEKLKVGMVLAIEPMFAMGTSRIRLLKDGYTYSTKDGSRSAHFEHTIAITKKGPIICTQALRIVK